MEKKIEKSAGNQGFRRIFKKKIEKSVGNAHHRRIFLIFSETIFN